MSGRLVFIATSPPADRPQELNILSRLSPDLGWEVGFNPVGTIVVRNIAGTQEYLVGGISPSNA